MGKYHEVKDLFEVEDRMRTPIKGVRLRLRTEIRRLGIKDKFRTDILRPHAGDKGPILAIISKHEFPIPITEFEGMPIRRFIK